MYPFWFENGDFFPLVWPTVHIYLVKIVTKMHLFKNAIQSEEFWKRWPDVYMWTDENGGFRIRWCYTSFAYYNQLQKCWDTPTKNLLVTLLCNIKFTSLLPSIQSCSSKFWVLSCISSNFDKRKRRDHTHKIIRRPVKPK